MKRALWVVVAVVSLTLTAYASIFLLAEAFSEVVVLRTFDPGGHPHDTRVTVIDVDGTPWVRGRPHRGWFQRIEANPAAELRRRDRWLPVRGEVSRDPADAAAFERVMLEHHGLLYRYLDLIARMSSNEIPVRLLRRTPQQPAASGPARRPEEVRWRALLARAARGCGIHPKRPRLRVTTARGKTKAMHLGAANSE